MASARTARDASEAFERTELYTTADAGRSLPSYGAEWDAAIEFGVDVTLVLSNLELSPRARVEQPLGARSSSVIACGRRSTRSAAQTRTGQRSCISGPRTVAADSQRLLRALLDAGFEFVVIDGVAAPELAKS